MNDTSLLLNAYYEALYERLEDKREIVSERIEEILRSEIAQRGFGNFDEDKFSAYLEASLSFLEERIELYNPTGIQYTFDNVRSEQAAELELQLNWYDSREEFDGLVQAVRALAEKEIPEEKMEQLTDGLIKQCGAFPDSSIISAYEAKPSLGKLPDYVVAQAIEEVIR